MILVAHSAGVLVTLHWAQRYGTVVKGALLATPPDLAQPLPGEYPSLHSCTDAGWLPIPRGRLPFPSIVAASRNDALGDYGRASSLAAAWGSRLSTSARSDTSAPPPASETGAGRQPRSRS